MLSFPLKSPQHPPLASPDDHSFTYRHDSISAASVGSATSPETETEPPQPDIEPVFPKEDVAHQPVIDKKSALAFMIRSINSKQRPSPDKQSILSITVFADRSARELTDDDWRFAQPIEIRCERNTEICVAMRTALNRCFAQSGDFNFYHYEMRMTEKGHIDFDFPALGIDTLVGDIDTSTFAITLKPNFSKRQSTRSFRSLSDSYTTLLTGTRKRWCARCLPCVIS